MFKYARSEELCLFLCFHDTRNKRKFGAGTVLYQVAFSVEDGGVGTVVEVALKFFMSDQDNRELLIPGADWNNCLRLVELVRNWTWAGERFFGYKGWSKSAS